MCYLMQDTARQRARTSARAAHRVPSGTYVPAGYSVFIADMELKTIAADILSGCP
jgi:hypothetical protein